MFDMEYHMCIYVVMLHSNSSTTAPASGADFGRWQAHAKGLPTGTIRFIINDCQKARDAMLAPDSDGKPFNQTRADFYLDQLITYKDELIERAQNR